MSLWNRPQRLSQLFVVESPLEAKGVRTREKEKMELFHIATAVLYVLSLLTN